jgi:succinyl-CoA synthetase alpha subunit/RimJ/RimL family protein N-acetyltransferase
VASDGGIVHLRPILPSDADALLRFHEGLSERTRYLRFFGPYPRIPPRDLERFTTVDHRARVAFICLLGDEIIAVGRYEGLPGDGGPGGTTGPDSAEVAFVARDEHQGRGLGSILLEHLAAAARENGLRRFEAEVLVENHAMVRVFRQAGYQVTRSFADGVLHLEFDIDPTERSLAVRDSREQRAEARSVHNALHPTSVAVIGASADPSKIGHAVLSNLLRGNFTGPVYPVNPEARSVRGVRAYPSVTDIPDDVDLAVVAVPAAGVDEVMDSCLAKGVKTLVVVSAGFAETGADGSGAQRRLVEEARAHGMRVIGPNALGIANTAADVRLNATLAPRLPDRGRVGFFSQSGALGIAILAAAAERGLGLSTFVSAGNRADLSGNDLLQYWQTDPATDVVLLYLETFGNPRKFARLARRLARTTPIVAVKSGRHSGVVPAHAEVSAQIDDASVKILFEQAGVIRVETLSELFDTAVLLAYQPQPEGARVAVVGNSTALGLLVTDGLLDEGLEPAGDPVDVGASATPVEFAAAVTSTIGDAAGGRSHCDAMVVVFVPPIATPGAEYARALREAVAGSGLPVVAVFLAVEGVPGELAMPGEDGSPGPGSVPSFPSPGRGVRRARWHRCSAGPCDGRRRRGRGARRRDRGGAAGLLRHPAHRVPPGPGPGRGRRGRRRARLPRGAQGRGGAVAPPHRLRRGPARPRRLHRGDARRRRSHRAHRRRRVLRAAHGTQGAVVRAAGGRRPVVRVTGVVRAVRGGHRAARGPRVPGGPGVRRRRGRAGPRATGGPAAHRLPGQRTRPARRVGGPGPAGRADGRGPARAAAAGAGPGARVGRGRRRHRRHGRPRSAPHPPRRRSPTT